LKIAIILKFYNLDFKNGGRKKDEWKSGFCKRMMKVIDESRWEHEPIYSWLNKICSVERGHSDGLLDLYDCVETLQYSIGPPQTL
jgi:hypothetical protein